LPFPPGVDPIFVWIAAWFGLAVALAGLLTQQMGGEGLEIRVRARTYARLGRLNDFLTRRMEAAWNKTPSDDLVPDLDTLRMLESEVNRAVTLDHRLRDRTLILSIGRLAAVLEAAMALVFAAVAAASGARDELLLPAATLIGIGTSAALVALILGAIAAVRIQRGADFS
jgi:hypothetical protein